MDPRRREDMIHLSTSDVYIFSNFGQESRTEVYKAKFRPPEIPSAIQINKLTVNVNLTSAICIVSTRHFNST